MIDNKYNKMHRDDALHSLLSPVKIFTGKSFAAFLALIALQLGFTTGSAYAAASLAIAPTRVVFEGRTRTASVSLINRGTEPATFRIEFEEKQMTEDGQIKEIKSPEKGGMYSSNMVRYSPRQIILPPGQAQVVRLLLRKPPNLKQGEYRSHLQFREVPADSGQSIKGAVTNNKGLNINIIPIVAISIPVIVRHGKLEASTSLKDLKFTPVKDNPQSGQLDMVIHRTGNSSVYGNFVVNLDQGKGEDIIVAKINGIAVYTPNATRRFSIKLQAPDGVKLDHGTLKVKYSVPPDSGDRLLAESSLKLNR